MRNTIFSLSQWDTRVSDVFSIIKLSRVTHHDALEIVNKRIFNELNSRTKTRARYPSYVKGYVQGLISAHRAEIWRNHVEFCYMLDGVLFTTAKHDTGKPKTDSIHAAGEGKRLCAAPSGHFWSGTDKPY